eukprot:TRINITY_DN44096_c0_g1_i1.p1 TRINITY_DN44096_c0_g1~~TRINITY_DN44096_c0_g1_i1.p1  ORF type:complete len:806 (-),score=180.72 TRINITY_DN44096_c0_g1_i1:770-3187(-)
MNLLNSKIAQLNALLTSNEVILKRLADKSGTVAAKCTQMHRELKEMKSNLDDCSNFDSNLQETYEQAKRVNECTKLLRYVLRILLSFKKLHVQRKQSASSGDLLRDSHCIQQIKIQLDECPDLENVQLIKQQMAWLNSVVSDVAKKSKNGIINGIMELNRTDIKQNLTVANNLSSLKDACDECLLILTSTMDSHLEAQFDQLQDIIPNPSTKWNASTLDSLWKQIDTMLSALRRTIIQVMTLQSSIDNVNSTSEITVAIKFWEKLCQSINSHFLNVCQKHKKLQLALSSHFPQFRNQLKRFLKSTWNAIDLAEGSENEESLLSFDRQIAEEQLLAGFENLEMLFIQGCKRRTIKALNHAFPDVDSSSLVTVRSQQTEDIEPFAESLIIELRRCAVLGDIALVSHIQSTLQDVCTIAVEKLNSAVNYDKDAFQFSLTRGSSKTASPVLVVRESHIHNSGLLAMAARVLDKLKEELDKINKDISSCEDESDRVVLECHVGALRAYHSQFHKFVDELLERLFGGLSLALHAHMWRMKSATQGPMVVNQEGASKLTTSEYMMPLCAVLNGVASRHLPLLQSCRSLLTDWCGAIVCQTISVFIYMASMLRPVNPSSEVTSLLLRDFDALLKQLNLLFRIPPVSSLQKQIESFKALLKHEIDEILDVASCKLTSGSLRPAVVWFTILARSPEELQSPVPPSTKEDWMTHIKKLEFRALSKLQGRPQPSNIRMVDLLQSELRLMKGGEFTPELLHSWLLCDRDVWRQVRRNLESYVQRVNLRGDHQFTAAYPILLKGGPRCLDDFQECCEEK